MASNRGAGGGGGSKKSHTNEKFLLTRKTWRMMFDAGRKVAPTGIEGKTDPEIDELEEQFQRVCREEAEFIQAEELLARARANFKNRRCMSHDDGIKPQPPLLQQTSVPTEPNHRREQNAVGSKSKPIRSAGSRIITSPGGSNAPEYFIPPASAPLMQGRLLAMGAAAPPWPEFMGPGQADLQPGSAATLPLGGRRFSAQTLPGTRADKEAYLLSRAYGNMAVDLATDGSQPYQQFLHHVGEIGHDLATRAGLLTRELRSAFFNPVPQQTTQSPIQGLHEKLRHLEKGPQQSTTVTEHSSGFSSRSTFSSDKSAKLSVAVQTDLNDGDDDGRKPGSELPSEKQPHDGSKRSSADSGLSESTLETIRRYFKLVRRNSKSEKEKRDRFKKVNYDQSLRDIKAKGDMSVTVDDEFNKGVQVQEPFQRDKFISEIVPRKVRLPSETTTVGSDRSSDGRASLPTSPRYSLSATDNDHHHAHQGYQRHQYHHQHSELVQGRQWQQKHGHSATQHVDQGYDRRSTTDTGHQSQWSSNRSSVEIDVCDDDVFQHGSSAISSPMSPMSPGCPTATPSSRMGTPPNMFSPPPGSPVMTGSVRIQNIGGQYSWSVGNHQQQHLQQQMGHQHGYSPTTPSSSARQGRNAMTLIFGSNFGEGGSCGSAPNPSPLDSGWDAPHHGETWIGSAAAASTPTSATASTPTIGTINAERGFYSSSKSSNHQESSSSAAAAAASSSRVSTYSSRGRAGYSRTATSSRSRVGQVLTSGSAAAAAAAAAGGSAAANLFQNIFHSSSSTYGMTNSRTSSGQMNLEEQEISDPASTTPSSRRDKSAPAQHGSKLVAKKIWRARSKSRQRGLSGTVQSPTASFKLHWQSTGSNTWSNPWGRQVTLADTTILLLCEAERLALQQVSLSRLQDLSLSVTVNIPKETDDAAVSSGQKPKRRPYLLKRKAVSTGMKSTTGSFGGQDDLNALSSTSSGGGQMFAIPLRKCIELDQKRKLQSGSPLREMDTPPNSSPRCTSAASFSQDLERSTSNTDPKRKASCAGLSGESTEGLVAPPQVPMVPNIVIMCLKHLETYGLHTVGLFRVSSSKKRVRQLREDFDAGKDVKFNEENCPHDVATLLKEFFRDLPDPLLTRDLYPAFLQTQKTQYRRVQVKMLQELVCLLPVPNRDTLWELLSFLALVAANAEDRRTATGDFVVGNKMDSSNLATLFAPNILHALPPPSLRTQTQVVDSVALHAAERCDVINVVRTMIERHEDLFKVHAELLQDIYVHMGEKCGNVLDALLRQKAGITDEIEVDMDTSSSLMDGSECSIATGPIGPIRSADAGDNEGRAPWGPDMCEDGKPGQQQQMLHRRRGDNASQDSIFFGGDSLRGRHQQPQQKHSGTGGSSEDGDRSSIGSTSGMSWFSRRREKSSSRELDDPVKTHFDPPANDVERDRERRWFQRRKDKEEQKRKKRERSKTQGDIKYQIEVAQKMRTEAQRSPSESEIYDPDSQVRPLQLMRGSTNSNPEMRHRSTSDKTVIHGSIPLSERLSIPEMNDPMNRRRSSPQIERPDVITASLKIPVPTSSSSSFGLDLDDKDIPFIEDNDSSSRGDDSSNRSNASTLKAVSTSNNSSAAKKQQQQQAKAAQSSLTTVQTAINKSKTGSNESFLGHPVVAGSMTFQPLTPLSSSMSASTGSSTGGSSRTLSRDSAVSGLGMKSSSRESSSGELLMISEVSSASPSPTAMMGATFDRSTIIGSESMPGGESTSTASKATSSTSSSTKSHQPSTGSANVTKSATVGNIFVPYKTGLMGAGVSAAAKSTNQQHVQQQPINTPGSSASTATRVGLHLPTTGSQSTTSRTHQAPQQVTPTSDKQFPGKVGTTEVVPPARKKASTLKTTTKEASGSGSTGSSHATNPGSTAGKSDSTVGMPRTTSLSSTSSAGNPKLVGKLSSSKSQLASAGSAGQPGTKTAPSSQSSSSSTGLHQGLGIAAIRKSKTTAFGSSLLGATGTAHHSSPASANAPVTAASQLQPSHAPGAKWKRWEIIASDQKSTGGPPEATTGSSVAEVSRTAAVPKSASSTVLLKGPGTLRHHH